MNTSDRPTRSGSRRSRSSDKFMPNMTQLQEAAKELPDPEIWPEESYRAPVTVNEKKVSIKFVRKSINRGKEEAPRWVYEGKVLIRNRDIQPKRCNRT